MTSPGYFKRSPISNSKIHLCSISRNYKNKLSLDEPNLYLTRELPDAFRLDREREMFDSKHSYNEKSGNSTLMRLHLILI